MAWGNLGAVTVSTDHQIKTTYDGDLIVSGESHGYYWDDPTAEELENDPNLYRVVRIVSRPYSKRIHVTAITTVVTTVTEYRGLDGPYTGIAPLNAGGKKVEWARGLNSDGFGIQASGELRLLECRGVQRTVSARRVNEANGWVTTVTEVSMSTAISTSETCTITDI